MHYTPDEYANLLRISAKQAALSLVADYKNLGFSGGANRLPHRFNIEPNEYQRAYDQGYETGVNAK